MPRVRKLLRVCRAEQEPRLTQGRLASLAGIHRIRYWAIEHGETIATPAERIQIANVLGVPIAAIAWPERPAAVDTTSRAEKSA